MFRAPITALALLSVLTTFGLAGCHSHPLPLPSQATAQVRAQQVSAANTQRAELDLIPPPSKNRFMTIHSFEGWENPYLTVQDNMILLHITQADVAPGSFGTGGMLRPVAAREQVVSISPEKLGEAMVAIPASAWPYGRVIAVEEAHKVPPSAEPAVRRTMEATVNTLTDLGIVVYDPTDGNIR